LDELSVSAHQGERRVIINDQDDNVSIAETATSSNTDDVEVPLDPDTESDDETTVRDQNAVNLERSQEDVVELPPVEEEGDTRQDASSVEQVEFPDTEVDLEHLVGDRFQVRPRTEDRTVTTSRDKPTSVKQQQQTKKKQKQEGKQHSGKKEAEENKQDSVGDKQDLEGEDRNQPQSKRGQKYKLKKIKEKYKDQDEEDRKLAMEILQSDGKGKETKSKKGKKDEKKSGKKMPKVKAPQPLGIIISEEEFGKTETQPDPDTVNDNQKPTKTAAEDQDSDEEKDSKQRELEDASLLDTLTGLPTPEDVLMFAIPVCAPYTTMLAYKYKIKLTPGTGKRGKATKTALHMFMQDKGATQREKDLFKSVKDQDLARNLPGKVKLSAPQLTKLKHR
jgi:hypothetical protein